MMSLEQRTAIELAADWEMDRRFLAHLSKAYPHAMKASELAKAMNLFISKDPSMALSAIVKFHNVRIRASQVLARFGYRIERDGGSMSDKIWIVG